MKIINFDYFLIEVLIYIAF